MPGDQPDNVGEQMNQALTHGYGPKVARAVLALLGAVPFVGGAFGGAAGAWSEAEQGHFNKVAASWLKLQEDEIKEIGVTIAEILSRLDLNDAEIQKRLAAWRPPQPRFTSGVMAKYALLVSSSSLGAVTAVPATFSALAPAGSHARAQ